MAITVNYDDGADVLYVKDTDHEIVTSTESPSDVETVLNYNAQGEVCGLIVIGAAGLKKTGWAVPLDAIPEGLHQAVTNWVESNP